MYAEKECSKCHLTKPCEEFSKNRTRPDGLQSQCKACQSERAKPWRFGRYGITEAEFLTMLVLQNSQCAICEEDFQKPRDIQIDHLLDRVRALLCRKCNTGLHFIENLDLRQRMISYVEGVA